MLNPWEFKPGVVFDARSVLLGISGLFFGIVPTLLAVLMTGAFRLSMGGAGAWTGVAVIVTSGGIGVAWRHLRRDRQEYPSMCELYLLGLVVHVAMLLWMLSLGRPLALSVLSNISLPVMLIYPVATALLGRLVVNLGMHKRAEEALRESESRYRAMFENMGDGVAVYQAVNDGEDFTFLDLNTASEKIDHLKKEELVGQSLLKVFPGVKEFGLFEVFQRVWSTGKPEHHPVSLYKDKRLQGWRDNFVYKLPSGEVVAIYSDETERKRAEAALKESEGKYRDLYEHAPDAHFSVSAADGSILNCNKAAARISGYDRETLLEMKAIDLYADTPDGLSKAEEVIRAVQEGEIIRGVELQMKHRDGHALWVSLFVEPVKDHGGKITESRVVAIDISERKNLQAQFQQAQKMESVGIL
ncbi:MAG: PAS domain S-box protein, partial [Thermodesulfobacteriota bacterium]|nr:PAS domain S-box protein [Thermodesulfobacteriota bacterium]